MAEERRYSEEEVDAILKEAAEVQTSRSSLIPSTEGMTLSQLQEIAREAGISPEAVQLAAQRVNSTPAMPTRRFMGFPLGVGRTVELDRRLTDEEWDHLVADLRSTFNARGVMRQEGSLRSWSNGNLQVSLEPMASGQRLRLRTLNAGARGLLQTGIAMFAVSAVVTVSAAIKGTIGDPSYLSSVITMLLAGTAMFGVGAFGLPGWANRRREQMDEIAERVSVITTTRGLPEG